MCIDALTVLSVLISVKKYNTNLRSASTMYVNKHDTVSVYTDAKLVARVVLLLAFVAGLFLGLTMILPIGPQNIFVLTQGMLGGWRAGLLAATVTGICDTKLIVAGGAGIAVLLSTQPILQGGMLWLGTAFLIYLGARALLFSNEIADVTERQAAPTSHSLVTLITAGVGVSWGNPHAILDTLVILGSAITAQGRADKLAFAAGAVAASWLFFIALASAGALFGVRVGRRGRFWTQRISGILMLLFAIALGYRAIFVIQ
jgi:L-lysine exporter family protein LysE/ArgO